MKALLWSALLLAISPSAAAAGAEEEPPAPSPQEQVLQRHGVSADREGLADYLRSLHPGPEARRRAADLIRRLGNERFDVREEAMKELLRTPVLAVDLLTQGAEGGDPEVRWRCKIILAEADQRAAELLHAAFLVIVEKKIAALAEPLFESLPLLHEAYLQDAARRAIVASSTRDDLDLLHRRLAEGEEEERVTATAALATVLEADFVSEAAGLLDDDSPRVRLTAARALAQQGDRRSLAALLALLDHDDLEIRVGAARLLRAATGESFNYVPYEAADQRAAARDKWRGWLAENGETVEIKSPLSDRPFEMGRTLVAIYGQNKIVEFDRGGKQIWEKAVENDPWGIQGLPNGHRLVATYSNQTVREFDAQGKEVWTKTGLPGGPTGVERLENGNTLIACTDSQRVVEVDRSGKIVWDVTVEGRPCYVQRLDNGRTFVVLQNAHKIVEVDRAGKVVWEQTGLSNPFGARRLENGNTLVANMNEGAVVEYDASGKKVWSKTGFSTPYDAQRTATGTTLIVDSSGVTEVDAGGKELWKFEMQSVSRVDRY